MTECTRCGGGNKKNGRPKMNVNGKSFKLKLDAKSVCEVCAEEEFLVNFDKFNKYIKLHGEEVYVDWKNYPKLDKEVKAGLSKILVTLGILAYESQHNWEIVGKGNNLNPKIQGQILYFRRKEDVLNFASSYCWNSYPCEVRRISKTIKQDEFIS